MGKNFWIVIQNHNSTKMQKLRKDVLSCMGHNPKIALERAYTYTRVYQDNLNDSFLINKARAFKEHLSNVTLYIRDYDLLPGSICEIPGGVQVCPELGIGECNLYTNEYPHRKGYMDNQVPQEIIDFWEGKNAWSKYKGYLSSVLNRDVSNMKNANWQYTSCQGHLSPDFGELLKVGISGILNKISCEQTKINTPSKNEFLLACKLTIEGLSIWIERYSKLANSMIDSTEDVVRQEELRDISISLHNIANNPPANYKEAIRLIWLAYQAIHIEGNGYSCDPGRLDQLLYPYYLKDKEQGIISDDEVITLFENFILKMKDNTFWGVEHNLTQGVVVSGSDINGTDQTNNLSYFILKAGQEMKLPEPLIWVRWHKNISKEFFDYALEVLGHNTCFPMFMNDDVIIPMLVNRGMSLKDAYDYVPVGCNELGVPGRMYYISCGGVAYIPCIMNTLKQAIQNGTPPTFEDFLNLTKNVWTDIIKKSYQNSLVSLHFQELYKQTPLTSCFFYKAIENGIDISKATKYNYMLMNCLYLPNFVDSLGAIKKTVYDDHSLTLSQILQACQADYVGYEDVQKKILACPKHGNDDEYLDGIVKWVVNTQYDILYQNCFNPYDNSHYFADCVTRSAGALGGLDIKATPDGRNAGKPMANSVACACNQESISATALLNSIIKLDAVNCWGGTYNANIRFSNRMFQDEEHRKKLASILNAYFKNGGQELQINTIDSNVLKQAQLNPQDYQDLVVRVAGFSEFFVNLRKEHQDDIISRACFDV